MYKSLFLIIVLAVSFQLAKGQDSSGLYMSGFLTTDSLILRWAPDNLEDFNRGIESGYVLERLLWKEERYELLDTIKILGAYDTEQLLNQYSDDYAAQVAGYILYNEEPDSAPAEGLVSQYKKFNEQTFKLNFGLVAADLSPRAAQILGLRYVVRTIDPERKAIYRIRSIGLLANEPQQDTAVYYLNGEMAFLPVIDQVELSQHETVVELRWPYQDFTNFYSAYDVLRSSSLNGDYERVNSRPIYMADDLVEYNIHLDSVNINKIYFYKIQGYSSFGILGPLSEAYRFDPVDSEVGCNVSVISARGNHESITVEWELDITNESKVDKIQLIKSFYYSGPYYAIADINISGAQRSYVDENIGSEREHYYRLLSINPDGVQSLSLISKATYIDTIAPNKPAGMKGFVGSSGITQLYWQANEEDDLKGYRLYMSNRNDGIFYHVHDNLHLSNVYEDTVGLDFINRPIYYKVVAVDYNNNHSEYSDLLTVLRPDTIPPVVACIYRVEKHENKVKLFIHPSTSKDVESIYLLRNIDSLQTDTIDLEVSTTAYVDTSLSHVNNVRYALELVDSSGNSSRSAVQKVKIQRSESSINNVVLLQDGPTGKLKWSANLKEGDQLNIYLQKKDEDKRVYLSRIAGDVEMYEFTSSISQAYRVQCILQTTGGIKKSPVYSNWVNEQE